MTWLVFLWHWRQVREGWKKGRLHHVHAEWRALRRSLEDDFAANKRVYACWNSLSELAAAIPPPKAAS